MNKTTGKETRYKIIKAADVQQHKEQLKPKPRKVQPLTAADLRRIFVNDMENARAKQMRRDWEIFGGLQK